MFGNVCHQYNNYVNCSSCQNPEYINAMFHVRKVEEENIRMSVFVKNNFGSFERGRAFYEFIQKEDLLFWTKAIRMKKGNIKVNINFLLKN